MALLNFLRGPDNPVNYRGDALSRSEQSKLFGTTGFLGSDSRGLDPAMAASMFANWLTGGKPAPIDPGVSLARSAAMAGLEAKAGAGRGVSGLFGLGNILGGGYSPMATGVPYSVPPIPNIFRPGGGLPGPGSPAPGGTPVRPSR